MALLCSRWPISLVCFRYVWVPGMLVHAIAWVRVVHVRRRRCLVVQRFDRSRSKPNNVRAVRCPRLSAMDVEHFDLESDPAPKKKKNQLFNHLLSRGSLLCNRQSSNDRCARCTTRLWVTSFEFVVKAPLDVPCRKWSTSPVHMYLVLECQERSDMPAHEGLGC